MFLFLLQQDYFEDYESLKGSDDEDSEEEEKELMKNLSQPNRKIARPPRPNSYGSIEGNLLHFILNTHFFG